jgi:hypothetical protein
MKQEMAAAIRLENSYRIKAGSTLPAKNKTHIKCRKALRHFPC